jgi:hypothetical protein
VLEYIIQSSKYLSVEYCFCFSILVFVFILSSEKPTSKKTTQQAVVLGGSGCLYRCYRTRSSLTPTRKSRDKYGVWNIHSIRPEPWRGVLGEQFLEDAW